MTNVLGAVAGVLVTLAGVALVWTPIPIGLVLIVIGLSMLAAFNPWMRERIRGFRSHHHGIDSKARDVERRMPGRVRRAWERTDPERDGEARR